MTKFPVSGFIHDDQVLAVARWVETMTVILAAINLALLVFHVASILSLFASAFMRRWSSLGIRAMSRLAFVFIT
jgi:hypothetical protein